MMRFELDEGQIILAQMAATVASGLTFLGEENEDVISDKALRIAELIAMKIAMRDQNGIDA